MEDARTGATVMTEIVPQELVKILGRAKRVVAFTGAGVSAESGVPTFRGKDGIWTKFKPEELASVEAFMKNPELVWEWYSARRLIMASTSPNPGHYALAEMEQRIPHFTLVTQNIDNLHQRAGSRNVLELHGNIERSFCLDCNRRYGREFQPESGHPKCRACGGLVRPDVVWFGEFLPRTVWEASEAVSRDADVFLSIGTSGVVFPAASLPMLAKQSSALLVEVNPEPTPLTDIADYFLQGSSGVVLPTLWSNVQQPDQHHQQQSSHSHDR